MSCDDLVIPRKHSLLPRLMVLAAIIIASGCTGDEASASVVGDSANRAQAMAIAATASTPLAAPTSESPTAPEAAPTSPWTTLGTRAEESAAAQPITTNADAKWTDYDPPALYPGTASLPVQFITMRDGVRLAVYVTLPADAGGNAIRGKTFPTILVQTSYNGGLAQFAGDLGAVLGGADPYMVKHGYATVAVDVRGTGQSGGTWKAFGAEEQADYAEVVKWVTQQPWFGGNIGVYGVSYLGITAIITASQDHPAVKAAFAIVPIGDGYRDIVFTGGMANPTFMPIWLTLVTGLGVTNPCILTHPVSCLATTLRHVSNALLKFQVPTLLKALLGNEEIAYDDPSPGSFWEVRSPLEDVDQIDVPTFVVGGLDDIFQRSEPITYAKIKHQATAKLLIGPWTHIEAALGKGLPADGVSALNHIQLRWFDQYLKGMDVGAEQLPNVTQYVRGYGHYVTAVDWPHPQASARRLYLHGDRALSTDTPTDREKPHIFLTFPAQGLCSRSASQWTIGILGLLPLPCTKHNNTTDRWNVKYHTAPMPEDVYINGPIQANLWISSWARDAVLSVRVSDVAPNGVATALTNGVQLASMRVVDESRSRYLDGEMIQPWHPYTKASKQPLTRGQPTLVRVEIFPTSALIKKGHRLRISVGAANTPQALPTLPDLLRSLTSPFTTIYSDADHPSNVVIPVVPSATLDEYD